MKKLLCLLFAVLLILNNTVWVYAQNNSAGTEPVQNIEETVNEAPDSDILPPDTDPDPVNNEPVDGGPDFSDEGESSDPTDAPEPEDEGSPEPMPEENGPDPESGIDPTDPAETSEPEPSAGPDEHQPDPEDTPAPETEIPPEPTTDDPETVTTPDPTSDTAVPEITPEPTTDDPETVTTPDPTSETAVPEITPEPTEQTPEEDEFLVDPDDEFFLDDEETIHEEETEEPEETEETPVPDVTVQITGTISRVTYDGQNHVVTGFTAIADNPDYDVERDVVFHREREAYAEQTDVGISYMSLSAEEFTNQNEAFDYVLFEVTDGFIEVVPLNVVVEIEGSSDVAVVDGEIHAAEGYQITNISCVYGPIMDYEFESYGCSYSEADFVFSGTAYAERSETGITYMGLSAEQFENINQNYGAVEFHITDGYQKITEADEEGNVPSQWVSIHSSLRSNIKMNDMIVLSAQMEGFGSCQEIRYQWKCDKGNGFELMEDGGNATYTFPATAETLLWNWQLSVYCK